MRCDGTTIDLSDASGERTLARLCASQPHPTRVRPATDGDSALVGRMLLWLVALVGAYFAARWSKNIDGRGFIDKETLAALFALGGLLLGRIVASLLVAVFRLAVLAGSAFAWLVLSVALASRRTHRDRAARGWERTARRLRTHARNLAVVPFGAPRVTPRAAPLGPVLEPRAVSRTDSDRLVHEGTIHSGGLAEIDGWSGSIIGIEGHTNGTDLCDAAIAPFRLRTDDGGEFPVRVDAGSVHFVEPPIAVSALQGLPVAWGVRTLHGDEAPVNVWSAGAGSRVRLEGGRLEPDGTLVGDAIDPIVVRVTTAVNAAALEEPPVEHLAVDTSSEPGTIAP